MLKTVLRFKSYLAPIKIRASNFGAPADTCFSQTLNFCSWKIYRKNCNLRFSTKIYRKNCNLRFSTKSQTKKSRFRAPLIFAQLTALKNVQSKAGFLLRLFRKRNTWNKYLELHLFQLKWNRNHSIPE